MKRLLLACLSYLFSGAAYIGAHNPDESVYGTNITADSISTAPSVTENPPRKIGFLKRVIRSFDRMDTTYITPNKYNWAFMLQNTNSYEVYTLYDKELGQKLSFSPKPGIKIGPYIGWRWIFLGYTFETSSLNDKIKSSKTEFELSLYSAMVGCDLIYRRTGNDFRLRKITGLGEDAAQFENTSCNGITVKVTGINAYYIFNHNRFSYPAAFAQSTVQRKSCGSWKIGFSYTRHFLDFNYDALPYELTHSPNHELSSDFQVNNLKYTDYSISCGYAYNWVFKRNWLFCISLSPAIGYKKADTDMTDVTEREAHTFFSRSNLKNFNIDATLRAGLVWNTTKYFGGLSLIVHNYNYRHKQLNISNSFGTLNIYMGLNFHKRKGYR